MHWLTHFGAVALPQYDVQYPAGPAPVASSNVALVGGGTFRGAGTGRARQRYPMTLRYQCSVVGPGQAAALASLDALKTQLGVMAKLWREEAGATLPDRQWCWAELTDLDDAMRSKMPWWIVPVTLNFSLLGRWNGLRHRKPWTFDDGHFFDDGLAFDSSGITTLTTAYLTPQTIVITNNGNQAVRDVVIRLTSASSVNTYLSIRIAGVSAIQWTGTLAANKVLEIDTAAKRVTNDGNDAYSGFSTFGGHNIADWLVLEPGANSVVVETDSDGPNSTIEFEFSDGWV